MEIVGEQTIFCLDQKEIDLNYREPLSVNRHNRVSPLHILKMEEQTQSSQYIVQGWALTTYTFTVPTA